MTEPSFRVRVKVDTSGFQRFADNSAEALSETLAGHIAEAWESGEEEPGAVTGAVHASPTDTPLRRLKRRRRRRQ